MAKILKRVVVGLIGIVVIAIVLIFIISSIRWNNEYHGYEIPVDILSIPTDEESIAWGEHIANTRYCRTCHGPTLSGDYLVNDPMVAVVAAPNLTSGAGGIGSSYTDDDWIRAIRHGVGQDGRGLIAMPSRVWHQMNDEDLSALIAYLQTIPPIDNELPSRQIGPLFRVLVTLGQAPPPEAQIIDHDAPRPEPVERGVTVEYGEYLAFSCTACHGTDFSGGTVRDLEGNLVTSLNLTSGGNLVDWSLDDFVTAIRTGQTPDGRQLSITMPWPYIGLMSDDELEAIWMYLQTLPALDQNYERTDM